MCGSEKRKETWGLEKYSHLFDVFEAKSINSEWRLDRAGSWGMCGVQKPIARFFQVELMQLGRGVEECGGVAQQRGGMCGQCLPAAGLESKSVIIGLGRFESREGNGKGEGRRAPA